jgi:hypothetical protein
MLSLKVPFLKPEEIEASVAEVRRNYSKWKGISLQPPIPIDDIVEGYLKLDFALADLKKMLGFSDVLGATWFAEKRVRVDESLDGQEGRYSFTLAHEVGHWILHRPIYEMANQTVPLFRREDVPAPSEFICRTSQKKEPAEWQADQFAARLLMPASHVRDAVRALASRYSFTIEGFDGRAMGGHLNETLRRLASVVIDQGNFTNVSNEAMCVRLIELNVVKGGRVFAGVS